MHQISFQMINSVSHQRPPSCYNPYVYELIQIIMYWAGSSNQAKDRR